MSETVTIHCSHSELVDVVKLVEHPNNPNQHDKRQVELLARIIKAQGWRNPITVSKRSGFIVSGHGRLAAAKLLNEKQVPVDYQDFKNDADETAHLLADNRVAELAELDFKSVSELLKELQGQDFELELTGFLEHEIEPLLEAEWSPPEIEEMDGLASGHTVKFDDEQWKVISQLMKGDASEAEVITAICRTHLQA